MKNIMKKVAKIAVIVVAAVLAFVILVVGGLNLLKFAIYHEYYSMETSICKNPGVNEGFMCQGLAVSEDNGVILVSGYMKDNSASRIYVTTFENVSYYIELVQGEEAFTGHCGGIATSGKGVYLVCNSRIYVLLLDKILSAKNGDPIDVGEGIEINNSASFAYTDDTYLYVGEFHNGGKYNIVGHENETAEGTHHAIFTKYSLSDLSRPLKVYSIRDKVQGICITPDGKVVMSTSYGLTSSEYYVYSLDEATDSGKTMDGASLYYLDKLEKKINGPAMSEGLDYYDGKVITMNESASDKYIFGKLFFAFDIVGLEF